MVHYIVILSHSLSYFKKSMWSKSFHRIFSAIIYHMIITWIRIEVSKYLLKVFFYFSFYKRRLKYSRTEWTKLFFICLCELYPCLKNPNVFSDFYPVNTHKVILHRGSLNSSINSQWRQKKCKLKETLKIKTESIQELQLVGRGLSIK